MTAIYNELTDAQKSEIRKYGVTVLGMEEAVRYGIGKRHSSPAKMAISMIEYCNRLLSQKDAKDDDLLLDEVEQTLNRAEWILTSYTN